MAKQSEVLPRFLLSAGLLSVATIFLLSFRILLSGTIRYWFIPENLALAWVCLLVAWALVRNLKSQPWSGWRNIFLSFLWLIFLPNAWYVVTDFVHIFPNGEVSQIFDIVLMSLLALTGISLGIASLLIVHNEMIKRLSELKSYVFIELAILTSSFAVYLGRDLRWNTWDVIKNPGGVIVNVSDSIVNPFGSYRALNVTMLFFVLVSMVYAAVWIFARPFINTRR